MEARAVQSSAPSRSTQVQTCEDQHDDEHSTSWLGEPSTQALLFIFAKPGLAIVPAWALVTSRHSVCVCSICRHLLYRPPLLLALLAPAANALPPCPPRRQQRPPSRIDPCPSLTLPQFHASRGNRRLPCRIGLRPSLVVSLTSSNRPALALPPYAPQQDKYPSSRQIFLPHRGQLHTFFKQQVAASVGISTGHFPAFEDVEHINSSSATEAIPTQRHPSSTSISHPRPGHLSTTPSKLHFVGQGAGSVADDLAS